MPEAPIPQPHTPLYRNFFLWTGLIATIAYRAIIVVEYVEGPWVKIMWYVGTIGFILYFAHRYQVTEVRSALIRNRQLQDKINRSNLSTDDQQALAYILGTLRSSKERWTYVTIFVSSGLALLAGAYLDLVR
ncbi:MAG: hypothetical protein HY421_01020 [Candidatus Kerfeldbacteria bacterium]|nr:hypothetical protein [Candidatus Kerfeldbacteria bacterium]